MSLAVNLDNIDVVFDNIKKQYEIKEFDDLKNWIVSNISPDSQGGYVKRTRPADFIADVMDITRHMNLEDRYLVNYGNYLSELIQFIVDSGQKSENIYNYGDDYDLSEDFVDFVKMYLPKRIKNPESSDAEKLFLYIVALTYYLATSTFDNTDLEYALSTPRKFFEPLNILKSYVLLNKLKNREENLPDHLKSFTEIDVRVVRNFAVPILKSATTEMSSKVKATWTGDGQPEGGIIEYGAGTENPTIPLGILKQRSDPNSNWTFEYVNTSTQDTATEQYLKMPVYLYTENGVTYYTQDKNTVPSGVESRKGCVADIYKLAQAHEAVAPGVASIHDNPEFKQNADVLQVMRETTIGANVKFGGNIVVSKSAKGFPLSKLYVFAMICKNYALADKIKTFASGKVKSLDITIHDVFPDEDSGFITTASKLMPSILDNIAKSQTSEAMSSLLMKVYAKHYETNQPKFESKPAAKPIEEKKPVQVVNQEVAAPVKTYTPNTQASYNLESTPFTVLNYFDPELLQQAVLSLDDDQKEALRLAFPEFLDIKYNVGKHPIPRFRNKIDKSGNSMTGVENVMEAVAQLKLKLGDPNLYLGSKRPVPFIVNNMPMDTDQEGMGYVMLMQEAFRFSLMSIANEQKDYNRSYKQFIDKGGRDISMLPTSALEMAARNMDLPHEVLDYLAGKTGETRESIQGVLRNQISNNLKLLGKYREYDNMGKAKIAVNGGADLVDAGFVLGMLRNAVDSGISSNEDHNLHEVRDNFVDMLHKLIGNSPVTRIDGNTVLANVGGRAQFIEIGELEYMGHYMDFYKDGNNYYLKDKDGEYKPMDSLTDDEKLLNLQRFVNNTKQMKSKTALTNILNNYVKVLHGRFKDSMSRVIGSKEKRVYELNLAEDAYASTETMSKATDVTSSVMNYITNQLVTQGMIVQNKNGSLAPNTDKATIARFFDENILNMDESQVCQNFGVNQNRSEFYKAYQGIMTNIRDNFSEAVDKSFASKSTKMGSFGTYFETVGLLAPVAHLCNNSTSIKLSDFRVMTQEEILGSTHTSGSKFMDTRNTLKGFEIERDGNTEYIVKENRPAGMGDCYHLAGTQSDRQVYVFEIKISQKKIQKAPLSQVSPFLRNLLQVARDSNSIGIADVQLVNLCYGYGEFAETPFSSIGKQKQVHYGRNDYTLGRGSNNASGVMNVNAIVDSYSSIDGGGLSPL